MKKINKEMLLVILILLSFSTLSWAGDSITLSVSCTIPAIPGVNAPPFEEKNSPSPAVRQTEGEKDTIIQEDNQQGNILVRTIYSR